MAGLGLDILGGLGTLSESVANIWTSGDKVEIAKYQADIAEAQATAEEKKYAMQLADQRLKQLAADEASKKKNQTLLYVGVGFGALLLVVVLYLFTRSKPSPSPITQVAQPVLPTQVAQVQAPSLQGTKIPKPKKLT
jgi:hypothetical protein